MRISKPVTVLVLALSIVSALDAQRRRGRMRLPMDKSRNHATVLQAFRPVVDMARQSTVAILSKGKQVALGTVVGKGGLLVTKASELGGGQNTDLTARLIGGNELPIQRLSLDKDNDLALLQIEADLPPIIWAQDVGAQPGSFLAMAGPQDLPVAYGVMSTQVHTRRNRLTGAFLGVQMSETSSRLEVITPNSGAAAAGLQVGDVVQQLAGKQVRNRQELFESIAGRKIGETLEIQVQRAGKPLVLRATLGRRPPSTARPNPRLRLWGALSKVKTGFREVIQHDAVLKPNQCGGPVVNLEGKAVGINIARVGRIETVALTGKLVRAFVAQARTAAKATTKSQRWQRIRKLRDALRTAPAGNRAQLRRQLRRELRL